MNIMNSHPKKLVIEPTTRCNFKCDMCVKQSAGCKIPEKDLEDETFAAFVPLLPKLNTIIFTGIGEPLLHPGLERFISTAKKRMPSGSIIGFQTNGKLLSRQKAVSLLEAGLNKICISVDTVQGEQFKELRNGGALSDIMKAIEALKHARQKRPHVKLQTGIEFVLMKKNMAQLPGIVEWAGEQQLDFVIVTHLTAYEKSMESETAWPGNSYEAVRLFERYQEKALQKNLNLRDYHAGMVKFRQSEKEKQLCDLARQLKAEALQKQLYINIPNLQSEPDGQHGILESVFTSARKIADKYAIDWKLPEIRPRTDRYCPFIEEKSMFAAVDGTISPCYFLWHHYAAARAGDIKQVTQVCFGNAARTAPHIIWNDPEYVRFRDDVLKYDYPNCQAWCEKRCDYVLEPFFQDCCINNIPCCDCHWSLGLLNCLH